MRTYLILLRGINVGGKNIVPMAKLRSCLEESGFIGVSTYIASGNVILKSDKSAPETEATTEKILAKNFKLDSQLIKVLALKREQLQSIINGKPKGFGEQPEKYHSDVVFLMGINPDQAMTAFNPREGVDEVKPGRAVIYSQRLSAELVKSRLSKIVASPLYESMTIRSWGTTVKLLDLLQKVKEV